MIVPMGKVYLVARLADRQCLLDTLRDFGMVHLVPVDPELATPDEATSRQVDAVKAVLQVFAGVVPRGAEPDLSPAEAAREVLDIQRRVAEGRNHLATLYHQLEQIAIWDDLRLEQIEQLRQAGIDVRFYAMRCGGSEQVQAECVAEVAELPDQRVVVAVANRTGEIRVPDDAEPMRLPARDAATIRAEAKSIDQSLHRNIERLHELAYLAPALKSELLRLEQQAETGHCHAWRVA